MTTQEGNNKPKIKNPPTPKRKPCQSCPRHFAILIGAPGEYNPADPVHDRSWSNYFRTIQLAFNKNIITLGEGEKVVVMVYEKGYSHRFTDDINPNNDGEGKEFKYDDWSGKSKNGKIIGQYKDANRYAKEGQNYVRRIKQWVDEVNKKPAYQGRMKYQAIANPQDFWLKLTGLNRLSRLWFSVHAAPNMLWLDLTHNANNQDVVENRNVVFLTSNNNIKSGLHRQNIESYKDQLALISDPGFGKVSKFYGCNTSETAKIWQKITGLASEGSGNAISFEAIDSDKKLKELGIDTENMNHLDRLEQYPPTKDLNITPDWQEIPYAHDNERG